MHRRCGGRRRWTIAAIGPAVMAAVFLSGCEQGGGGGLAIVQYAVKEADRVGSDAGALSSAVEMAAARGARLVVTPETALYRYAPYEQNGVTMADLAASYNEMVGRFSGLADRLDICLVIGLREPAGEAAVHNTAVFFGPDGSVLGTHRKAVPSKEEQSYTVAGGGATVFDSPVGRVGLAICKDVLNPSLRAAYGAAGIDLFVLIAADPDGRSLSPITEVCAAAECVGVMANQQIQAGNSAYVKATGKIEYFGGGEKIRLRPLP